MGHRALIAYERENSNYDIRYSHWGAHGLKLKNDITKDTPLGSESMEPEYLNEFIAGLTEQAEQNDMEVTGELTTAQDDTPVEPEPTETNLTLREIINNHLDFLHHEAFYVVNINYKTQTNLDSGKSHTEIDDLNVAAYRTLWFGLQYETDEELEKEHHDETVGNGAITTVRWYEGEPVGDSNTTAKFRGMKDVVGDMVDRGVMDGHEAQSYLQAKVTEMIQKRNEMYLTNQYNPAYHPST